MRTGKLIPTRRTFLLLAGAVSPCVRELPAQAQGRISVGANVHVSAGREGWAHDEYSARADLNHPGRLMVAVMMFPTTSSMPPATRSGLYVSSDNGKTWRIAKETDELAGDPVCAYGPNGEMVFVTLTDTWPTNRTRSLNHIDGPTLDRFEGEEAKRHSATTMYWSFDGGTTWSEPRRFSFLDREDIWIDQSSGPYRGRMYMHGSEGFVYSSDTGRTWRITRAGEQAKQLPPLQELLTGLGMLGKKTQSGIDYLQLYANDVRLAGTLLPDGTFLLPWRQRVPDPPYGRVPWVPDRNLVNVTGTRDGGATLFTPVAVSGADSDPLPVMASDHSNGPFRGRAYLLIGRKMSSGSNHIFITHSDDGGRSWSTPLPVSDLDVNSRAAIPRSAIAVNRNGVVGVQWYDTRESANADKESGDIETRLRFSASLDGGETWMPSVPVSTHQNKLSRAWGFVPRLNQEGGGGRSGRPTSGIPKDYARIKGDYLAVHMSAGGARTPGTNDYDLGLTPDADGTFHAFWLDNREKPELPPQLYTAPIAVSGMVTRPEAGLEDVTGKLDIATGAMKLEWEKDAVTVAYDYVLVNHSSETITALKLRVASLESQLGDAKLAGEAGAGGNRVIDLTAALPKGGLQPGQSLPKQTMRVRISPLKHQKAGAPPLRPDPLSTFMLKFYGKTTR
jgi:hypothetical protein